LEIHLKLLNQITYFPKASEPNPPISDAYDEALIERVAHGVINYKLVKALKEVPIPTKDMRSQL
jgi:hypothetical protein